MMKTTVLAIAAAATLAATTALSPAPAEARGGRVAAGIIGGLAAGAIIGGIASNSYAYGPGPGYAYGPGYGPGYGYEAAPAYGPGYYDDGYARRNNFVCQPGTVFRNENGKPTLCQ